MDNINYNEIDKEIVELVKTLNKVPGLITVSSCFGHGKYPCRIWINFCSIKQLNLFLWAGCFRYFNINNKSDVNLIIDNSDTNITNNYITCYIEINNNIQVNINELINGINVFLSNYNFILKLQNNKYNDNINDLALDAACLDYFRYYRNNKSIDNSQLYLKVEEEKNELVNYIKCKNKSFNLPRLGHLFDCFYCKWVDFYDK